MAKPRRRSPESAARGVARAKPSSPKRTLARPDVVRSPVATADVLERAGEPLDAFGRVWRQVRGDAARLLPERVSEANVHLAFEPSGRRTVSIQMRGRDRSAGRDTSLIELPMAAPAAVPAAIDLGRSLPRKVAALWDILGAVVSDLDVSSTPARQRIVRTFLLHLAGHESQLRTRTQDAGGPARSLFQFEAHRA